MNFGRVEMFRTMRNRRHAAIKRGRLAVLDIGSTKITGPFAMFAGSFT